MCVSYYQISETGYYQSKTGIGGPKLSVEIHELNNTCLFKVRKIKTLEKDLKYVQIQQHSVEVVYFTHFSGVSVVNFEQVSLY